MMRAFSRFLPLILLLTSAKSMPLQDTSDRDSDEDGILIEQALLRILEEEDQLESVVQEIEQLHLQHREHAAPLTVGSPGKDTLDQVVESTVPEDQIQGDQPFEELPQGDMPIEGPVDDNEAQEIEASPTPPMFGSKSNDSVAAERFLQEFASGEGRKRILQKEFIRERVWNYTRPGNHSEDPSRTRGKKVDPQRIHDFMRQFSTRHENLNDHVTENQPRPTGQQTLQDLLRSLNSNSNNGLSNSFTKSQSLFPSCEIPKNTDEDMWLPGENSFSINLLFNFNQTKLAAKGWDVLEATLRLYKMAQTQQSAPLITSCSLRNNNSSRNGSNPSQEISTTSEPSQMTTGNETTTNSADQQVRVTVYLYTRALKKNRVKRRRLESRLISLSDNEWTAWNVLTAAKVYLETRRNFGLLVEVEDEKHCLLPAHRIFKGINCSEEAATARPMPFPIINAYEEHVASSIGGTYTFNENLFPIMDIRSFESHPVIHGPSADVLSTAASQQSSEPELAEQTLSTRLNLRSSATPSSPDGHRHRHGDTVGSSAGSGSGSHSHRRRRKPNNADDFRSMIIPQRIVMTAAEQRRRLSNTTPGPDTR